jgi:hypothetical protein
MDGDGYLGCSPVVRARMQPVADHLLVTSDRRFDTGPPIVPRRFLPTYAPVFGDELKVAIALAGCRRGRVAEHAIPTRRHDDGCVGMTARDAGVNAFLIIRAVAGERGYRSDHLIYQRANQESIRISGVSGDGRADRRLSGRMKRRPKAHVPEVVPSEPAADANAILQVKV